jgi:hypothetical protein
MSEATDAFWAKKKEREELGVKINTQVDALREIVDQLSGARMRYSGKPWQWVQIINGGNIPSHISDSPLQIDLKKWPDARELTNLVSQWHTLDWDYRQAWVRLTQQEKEQLAAHEPESHLSPRR